MGKARKGAGHKPQVSPKDRSPKRRQGKRVLSSCVSIYARLEGYSEVGGAVEGAVANGFGDVARLNGGSYSRGKSGHRFWGGRAGGDCGDRGRNRGSAAGGGGRGLFWGVGRQVGSAFEVGDGAGDAQDAVEGTGRHVELGHAVFEFLQAGLIGPGELLQLLSAHLGVTVDAGEVFKARLLDFTRRHDASPDIGTAFGRLAVGHIVKFHRLYLHLYVNTIHQRAGDFVHVFLHLVGHTGALSRRMTIIAAGARIHRCHQHKRGRIINGIFGSGDGDDAVFYRLAHHFQHLARKFREFTIPKRLAPLRVICYLCIQINHIQYKSTKNLRNRDESSIFNKMFN